MDDNEARARLTVLWLDHKTAVENFARRRCEPRSAASGGGDADDIVQQVFLTAWRRIDDVPDEPRAWLLTVARNALLNQRRADNRRVALAVRISGTIEVVTRDDDHIAGSDGASASDGHAYPALRQAWARLSDAEREVLSLVAWDELSGTEAAGVMGITRPAFAMRLGRARRHLRDLLADTGRTSGVRRSGATVERSTNEPERLTPLARMTDVVPEGGAASFVLLASSTGGKELS